MKIILLGPQRRPTLDGVVRSLGLGSDLSGPVATVTAGWQEREPDDAELAALLGGRAVNLGLYRRWLDVQDRDPEYFAGARQLADTLAELQDLYLLRLDYALGAVYAVQRRSASGDAVPDAVAAVRELDTGHLRRVNGARLEFFERLAPHDRPVIAGHRAEVSAALADAAALIIAGGHVGVLAEVLHLFNVAAALNGARREFFDRLRPHDRPVIAAHRAAVAELLGSAAALVLAGGHVGVLAEVLHLFNVAAALQAQLVTGRLAVIAWSAGAMALTDRIVLFHDRSPHGPGHPEVYGSGLGITRDVVLLPHARARLLLDDTARMAVFARRFGPARCVLLEAGTRLELSDAGAGLPPGTRVLAEDGHVASLEAA